MNTACKCPYADGGENTDKYAHSRVAEHMNHFDDHYCGETAECCYGKIDSSDEEYKNRTADHDTDNGYGPEHVRYIADGRERSGSEDRKNDTKGNQDDRLAVFTPIYILHSAASLSSVTP